jgi:hypothetical protein
MCRYNQRVDWLKHAFGIDPEGSISPNEVQRAVVEKLCAEIGRRHLSTPALLMLETSRPLNYLSAQLLHFFQPIIGTLVNAAEYEAFARFLEQRGAVDYIVGRLEAVEAAASGRQMPGTDPEASPAAGPAESHEAGRS